MSQAKSPFIEASKHQEFSNAVENHFFGSSDPDLTGQSPMPGTKYTRAGDMPFNSPDSGVNYVPRSRAGHTTK